MAKSFVLGLGRIGLAHAVAAASSGHIVYGYDIDKDYYENLRGGKIMFVDDIWGEYSRVLGRSLFLEVPEEPVDFVVLGFGSHPGEDDWASKVVSTISKYKNIIKESIIIIRGTVHVGGTRELANLLKKAGWFQGDVYFVPERLVEGRALFEEKTLPVIYGGLSPSEELENYFNKITSGGIKYVGDWEIAEAVKLVNNTWRAATFALANAIFLALERKGLDPHKVFEFAGWRYPRGKMPRPGYVSGYCLSKDPIIFDESIGLGRIRGILEANNDVIDWTIEKARKYNKILVLGYSYKWDVDDYRSTHVKIIVEKLLSIGKSVYIHDPYYKMGRYSNPKENFKFVKDINCSKYDAIIIATPHSEYRNLNCDKPVIDIWNITASYQS